MKEELRNRLLAKRDIYPNWQEDSEKITKNFLSFFNLSNFQTFMLYYPYRREVDTRPLIRKLLSLNKDVALPKVDGLDLKPIKIKNLDNLVVGYAGIKEPIGEKLEVKDIDLVIVPAVAYDKQGYRIGYGKGFYDRFLPKLKETSLKVGFSYDFQLVEKIPHQPYDFKVDIIITPTQILKI